MEIISKQIKEITMRNGKTTKRMMVITRCPKCNKVYEKRYNVIDLKKEPTCKVCSTLNNNKNKIFKGCATIGDLSGTYYGNIISQVKQRNKNRKSNLIFDVSQQYLWDLFVKQNHKCALSNVDLSLLSYAKWTSTGKSRHLDTSIISASLDRIDSNGHYVEGNVQWVHKAVNIMKNTLSNNDFIWFCKKIAENKNKEDNIEPSFIYGDLNSIIMKKVQRLDIEGNRPDNMSTSAQEPISCETKV